MWKEKAKALFFIEHRTINDIAEELGKARETVSRHICALDGYEAEMSYRKEASAEKRRQYRNDWNIRNRKLQEERFSRVTAATMRAEHELAVKILSRDRH